MAAVLLLAVAAAGAYLLRVRTPSGPSAEVDTLRAQLQRQPQAVPLRLELAAAYAGDGQTFAAVEQLEAVRALGSPDELVLTRLADLYRGMGELEAAAEVLEMVAARPGASPGVRSSLSQVRLTLGDFQGAAQALEPLSAGGAITDDALRQRLVRQLLLAGRFEDAKRLLPAEPPANDPEWPALYGLHALFTGSTREAIRHLQEAVKRSPADAWNRFLLSRAYLTGNEPRRALYSYVEAAAMPDAPLQSRTGLAALQIKEGLWDGATRTLDQAANEGEDDPEYWRLRSLLEEHAGRPARAALARGRGASCAGDPWKAEQLYQEALAQRPADAGAERDLFAALISSAEQRFDTAAALRHATAAAARRPREPLFLRRQAELLLEENRYRDAQAVADRLLSVASAEQAVEVADLRVRIALEAGQGEALQRAAEASMRLDPKDPNPYLLLGEWYQQQGRSGGQAERALEMYRQAATVAPEDAEAYARLGSLLAELKRPDEAIPAFQRALTLSPRVLEGVPHVQIAQIYRRQGRGLEAAFHEERYQRLRRLKDAWPNVLHALRQSGSAADYRALGETALDRHDRWVGLWAYTRGTRLAPQDPAMWRGLAAAHRRLGRFEEAVLAMRRAQQLGASKE